MSGNRLVVLGIISAVLAIPLSITFAMGMSFQPWVTYPAYSLIIGLLFAWLVPAWKVVKQSSTPFVMAVPHVVFGILVVVGLGISKIAGLPLGAAIEPYINSKLGWFIGILIHIATWYAMSYPFWLLRGKPITNP